MDKFISLFRYTSMGREPKKSDQQIQHEFIEYCKKYPEYYIESTRDEFIKLQNTFEYFSIIIHDGCATIYIEHNYFIFERLLRYLELSEDDNGHLRAGNVGIDSYELSFNFRIFHSDFTNLYELLITWIQK